MLKVIGGMNWFIEVSLRGHDTNPPPHAGFTENSLMELCNMNLGLNLSLTNIKMVYHMNSKNVASPRPIMVTFISRNLQNKAYVEYSRERKVRECINVKISLLPQKILGGMQNNWSKTNDYTAAGQTVVEILWSEKITDRRAWPHCSHGELLIYSKHCAFLPSVLYCMPNVSLALFECWKQASISMAFWWGPIYCL